VLSAISGRVARFNALLEALRASKEPTEVSREAEVLFHHRSRDDDASNKARHHDDDKFWTVESYEAKTTKAMLECGAKQLPSRIDGKLFEVDAKQLIEFIAASSGLNVEFRARKRQTLSPEKVEARRIRMAELNQRQRAKV
jgi:hypothetical protein